MSSISDVSGTITSTVDFAGRTVAYNGLDAMASTSVFDPVTGRLVSVTDNNGIHGYVYDRGGRLLSQTLDGDVIAQPAYHGPAAVDPHALATVTYPAGTGNTGNDTIGTIARNSAGGTVELTWEQAGGGLITSDTLVRSQSGRIMDRAVDGVDPYPAGNNYTYDTATRLTEAHVNGDTYQYGYAPVTGCAGGAAAAAGANANRTTVSINATQVAAFCHDGADRLMSVNSSVAPFNAYTGSIGYDNHGNTTSLAGQELVYDAANRHLGTYTPNQATPTASVTYERDVFDRIIRRTELTAGVTTVVRYGYTGAGDTPDIIMDTTGTPVETLMTLPGGVLLTRSSTGDVWSYPGSTRLSVVDGL